MDIIQLQDNQDGWKIHCFATPLERDEVLSQHGITLGRDIELAPYVMIGDHAAIGDGVTLGDESVVSHHCRIGDGVSLAQGAFVAARAVIGAECRLEADSFVGADSELGAQCRLLRGAEVDANVVLGSSVSVGEHSYVMEHSVLDDGTAVARGCYVGNRSRTGFFVTVGEDTHLVRDVIVQDGATVAAGSRIPAYSTLTRAAGIREEDALRQAVARMGSSLQYERMATFQTFDGHRCVRAQIAGVWTPSQRVQPADAADFSAGRVSVRELCDRYIAAAYGASQQPKAGIRF